MKETLLPEQTQELVALGCQPMSTLTEVLRSLPLSFPVASGGFATLSMEWDGNYGEEWVVRPAMPTSLPIPKNLLMRCLN